MAQGNQLGRSLGGLDPGDPGDAEHVPLRSVTSLNGLRRRDRDSHYGLGESVAFGGWLGGHVDHAGPAVLVDVRQAGARLSAHAGACSRIAPSTSSRTSSKRPSRSNSTGSGSPSTIDSKNSLRSL